MRPVIGNPSFAGTSIAWRGHSWYSGNSIIPSFAGTSIIADILPARCAMASIRRFTSIHLSSAEPDTPPVYGFFRR
ncbi:hypothetical protein B4096_1229 [Heyndrickxia coagulans]|nr:hypothetical protein B4096_1229 [Heyndrickxia coagulans]